MSPGDRAEVSPDWLAQVRTAAPTPWTHGFALMERASSGVVGACGYKGPPNSAGAVEIAYGGNPRHRGRGDAKEGAAAPVEFAARGRGPRGCSPHPAGDG